MPQHLCQGCRRVLAALRTPIPCWGCRSGLSLSQCSIEQVKLDKVKLSSCWPPHNNLAAGIVEAV